MPNQRYIGIENEFTSFINGTKINFSNYFYKIDSSKDFHISTTAVRKPIGNGFYVDGEEVEILTPPIVLNKGFATRLTDSLMIGRDYLIRKTPGVKHTGYSMHWNLTKGPGEDSTMTKFYRNIAIPFQLFGLTPLSSAFNIRDKDSRIEILGDSLKSEEQIKACALLIAGYYFYTLTTPNPPLIYIDSRFELGYKKDANVSRRQGRMEDISLQRIYSMFKITNTTPAQAYLEESYGHIYPFIKKLGTNQEIKNLEEFIAKKKNLEIDEKIYFDYLSKINGIDNEGMYLPIIIPTAEGNKSQIITRTKKRRQLPLEARLWGNLIKKNLSILETVSWGDLEFKQELNKKSISETDNIYNYLQEISPELSKLKKTIKF